MLSDARTNYTVIVNWKQRGFGCSKACSYCNWRGSPYLPQGPQSFDAVRAFAAGCDKSFVTISGGGDPLYKLHENEGYLRAMSDAIRGAGRKVRVITREVQQVKDLRGIADYVSISLDDEVLSMLQGHQDDWDGLDIDYSIVLPPLPAKDLRTLMPQYLALRMQLGRTLVLRENFNSIFPLDATDLTLGQKGIVFVPRSVCLEGRYLAAVECNGHDLIQDNRRLSEFLMNRSDVLLFGGFVKHIMAPSVHLEYDDIDILTANEGLLQLLGQQFSFEFKETSPPGSYPRYFSGRSARAGKRLQVVLVDSMHDAERFVFNAQYAVDRVGYRCEMVFDQSVGEDFIRTAVREKVVHAVPGKRDLSLFGPDRAFVEMKHRAKLIRKGFTFGIAAA